MILNTDGTKVSSRRIRMVTAQLSIRDQLKERP